MEPLERRTLLDAASLNPHGMFPGEMFPAGETPDDMVLADVNEDGNPDVAATNRDANEIALLLGHGDGTLAQPVRFPAGLRPLSIAAADLDNDGHIDLVTGHTLSLTILLGRGDGTFEAQSLPLPGTDFLDVEVADIHEDGALDILTTDYTGGRLLILPGRGDGTFGDYSELAAGEGTRDVSVGDLNGDSHPDLVAANSLNNSVSVLLGQGEGNFQAETRYDVGQYPSSLELADLDEDGWTDLVVANYLDYTISVFFGTGDGRFVGEVRYSTGLFPFRPLTHDFDGDSHLDVLVPNSLYTNNITVLLNQNDRSFADGGVLPTGNAPHKVIAEDVNSDDREDLAVLAWGADAVAVHLAEKDGSYESPAYHTTELEPQNVVLADFNRDGHLDTASVNSVPSTTDQPFILSVYPGVGDGTFGDEIRTELPQNGHSPVVGDVNEDGDLDLVLTYGSAHSRTILLGNGDGTFAAFLQNLTEACYQQALGDVDLDGHLDLVCGNWDTVDGDVSLSVYRGLGDGTFSLASNLPISRQFTNGLPLAYPVVEHINGDEYPDLVVLGRAGVLLVLFGKEDASFHEPQIYPVPEAAASGVADFNEDGHPDSFVSADDSISILLNQGDGTFAAPLSSPDDTWIINSLATDLNRDGHADILSVIYQGHVRIHLGHGDGTFAQAVEYATGSFPGVPAIGDLDEDGWSDLAMADLWTGNLARSLQIPQARTQPHGITLGGASHLVTGEEGSTVAFKVTLDNRPTANVTILLSSSDTTEGTVSPASLTFTPDNWSTPQVVTVTGINDDLVDGPIAFSIVVDPSTSEDPVYAAAAPQNVQVVNIDDELAIEALGVIDFRWLQGLDLSGGVLGYSFQTTRVGLLTAELDAGSVDEPVELALFDAHRVEIPLVRHSSQAGKVRVEWTVKEGQQYVLLASGSAQAAQLRIANLLRRDAAQLTVYGTAGDDVYAFSAAGPHEVVVNGLAYAFDPAGVDTFILDGGDGADRLELFDSPADDSLRRASWYVSLIGPGYKAEATGFESVVAHADFGGKDVAQLDVTIGIDGFVGTPTWSELTGQAYQCRAERFEEVHAYRRHDGGDTAVLHGGAANDKWKSYETHTLLRAVDLSYLVRTKFFEKVFVDGGPGGTDTALFYDTPDQETFHFDGRDLTSRIRGRGRDEHVATGFRRVAVYGGEGYDEAYLTDSVGSQNDVFYLKSHKSQLVAEGIDLTVRSYDTVHVEADQQGFDVARIYDTSEDDHLEVAGNTARLYRRYGDSLALLYETIAVERVKAYRTTGNDTRDIQDHTLDLLLYGWDEV
ncbi:MAG: FG-GAP repeat domain-containing protein [Thermoguttaceae bacterium]